MSEVSVLRMKVREGNIKPFKIGFLDRGCCKIERSILFPVPYYPSS